MSEIIVVYDSLTGQSKRLAEKLGYPSYAIDTYVRMPQHQIFLMTRSIKFGNIPDSTVKFLDKFKDQVIGTAVSGNRNWGLGFGKAGDRIAEIYHIPLVLKFEGSGFKEDVTTLKTWLKEHSK